MTTYLEYTDPQGIPVDRQKQLLTRMLRELEPDWKRVLLLPPDATRSKSGAGLITNILYAALASTAEVDIMPALGTHAPMSTREKAHMFGTAIPEDRFLVHDWRNNLYEAGRIPRETMREWSEGKIDDTVDVCVDRILTDGYDAILSIGQVVPHEVAGMANYTKNVCVGAGGADIINKSHYLGAVYGMERIMGRIDTPPRKLYNQAVKELLADLPLHFILTVVGEAGDEKQPVVKGLFAGDDDAAFLAAAEMSQRENITYLDRPIQKAVVYLPPDEFKSTWLGNKAIYRTRMAMADDGHLIVLAPGVSTFGEDAEIDRLVRKFGYRGTPATLDAVTADADLRANLGAAAHLIHGSSEGRFKITYCPGPDLSREEIENVGFEWGNFDEVSAVYHPEKLVSGWNDDPEGGKLFFIPNPALGLWAVEGSI